MAGALNQELERVEPHRTTARRRGRACSGALREAHAHATARATTDAAQTPGRRTEAVRKGLLQTVLSPEKAISCDTGLIAESVCPLLGFCPLGA